MKDLTTIQELEAALAPDPKPVLLYKHSTQCGICDAAIEEVQSFEAKHPDAATIYYLDLLAHRDVSNAIAQKLGIRHESPQLILLKEGKPVAVLNHRAIRADALAKAIA
jgi:bacillithiol system protein YtxJ